MREPFFDILAAFSYSTRSQVAIFIGGICFFIIEFAGLYTLDSHAAADATSSLFGLVTDLFARRYGDLAWGVLLGSFWLAAVFYRKDKRKLWPSCDDSTSEDSPLPPGRQQQDSAR